MLFNSLNFTLFLPIVLALYWFVFQKNLKVQNALIFMASYVFYGWWDCRWKYFISREKSNKRQYNIPQFLNKP